MTTVINDVLRSNVEVVMYERCVNNVDCQMGLCVCEYNEMSLWAGLGIG